MKEFKGKFACHRCGRPLYANKSRDHLLCSACERDEKSLEKMARKLGLERNVLNTPMDKPDSGNKLA